MTIPTFQEITLPLLKVASDGKVHVLSDVRKVLAAHFGLSSAEEEELLPSGRQGRFANRVAWAKVYMRDRKINPTAKSEMLADVL